MNAKSAAALGLSLFLIGIASADKTPGKSAPAPFVKLKPILTLDPAVLRDIPMVSPAAPYEVEKALADLKTSLEALWAEQNAYLSSVDSCKKKSYTVEDMHAAGCTDSDTVAKCSHRLFSACTYLAFTRLVAADKRFTDANNNFQAVVRKITLL